MAKYAPGRYLDAYTASYGEIPDTPPVPPPPVGDMTGVTQDAASSKYFPATLAEWTTTMTAASLATGNPSAIWLKQEASGNPADVTGTFPLTAAGTPNYQQVIAGYTRKGIVMDDNAGDTLTTASASLPDLSTTSQMILAVVRMPSAIPAALRAVIGIGTAGTRFHTFIVNATGKLRATHGANSTDSAASVCDGSVQVIVLRHNKTAGECDVITNLEKLSPTFSASVAGKGVLFTSSGATAANVGLLYSASFHGAAAELTDAQIKTLLTTLGWTVVW